MSVNLFLLIPRFRGSPPPLHYFLTLFNQFSGSPQDPFLAKPLIGLSPAIKGSSICRKHSAPLVRRLLHFVLAAFVRINLFWTLPHRLPETCRMLGYHHHGLGFRRLRDLCRPKWVLFVQSRPKWVLSVQSRPKWVLLVQGRPKWVLLVQGRPKWVLLVQGRPKWVLLVQSSILLSLVHLGDGPLTRLSVSRTTHLPPPAHKRRRVSGNSSEDEDPSSQNRQQRDDQQDEEDNFRPALLDLLNYITKKFPAASQSLVQPSSKRFHVMESAGLVDESSQQSPNLAWLGI